MYLQVTLNTGDREEQDVKNENIRGQIVTRGGVELYYFNEHKETHI